MRRLFLLLIILAVLPLVATSVYGQTPVELDKMEVALWPEYDQPSVLVIYRITLSPAVELPAQLRLGIPAAVGKPFNLASKEKDGNLYNLEYTTNTIGEWTEVLFSSPSAQVQLEYYDNGLQVNGQQRHFTYRWAGDYAIRVVTTSVQQPASASDMKVKDFNGQILPGADGLNYHISNLGAVKAGQQFEITFDYRNETGRLSAGSQPLLPSAPLSQQTPGRITFSDALPWILATIGLILAALGLIWLFKRQSDNKSPRQGVQRERQNTGPASKDDKDCPACVYCHQCGKRSSSGDLFCRACGAKLRHE